MRLQPVPIPAVPRRFGAAPPRLARVLESRAPTGRGVRHDLVPRVDAEQRDVQPMPVADAPFRADLGRAARRRAEREI